MNYNNKHGLSRTISEDIKRKIRQDAKFGCVVCGCGIYEYEHIIPEFSEAREHNPEHMTLLCPTCHSKVTKGAFSKESVLKAKLNPAASQKGFSNEWFDFDSEKHPYVIFGGTKTTKCEIPLEIYGVKILEIKRPEQKNTPFLLSGIFYNTKEEPVLQIIDNEWRNLSSNWDFKFEGPRMTILNDKSKIVLQLKAEPPNGIIIEHLEMNYKGQSVIITPDYISINTNKFYGGIISNGTVGFCIR